MNYLMKNRWIRVIASADERVSIINLIIHPWII